MSAGPALVGEVEAAFLAGFRRFARFRRARSRPHDPFPPPVRDEPGEGPLWRRADVVAWAKARPLDGRATPAELEAAALAALDGVLSCHP